MGLIQMKIPVSEFRKMKVKAWRMTNTIYDSVELTEEETKAAILEAKKKKYFHEKHKDYWEAFESKKGKKCTVTAEK